MWKEKKKQNKQPHRISVQNYFTCRYIGVNWLLYHVHLQWIYQNSLADCSAPSGYYLGCCNIPVPHCCGQPRLGKSPLELPEDLLCDTCQGLTWQIENQPNAFPKPKVAQDDVHVSYQRALLSSLRCLTPNTPQIINSALINLESDPINFNTFGGQTVKSILINSQKQCFISCNQPPDSLSSLGG